VTPGTDPRRLATVPVDEARPGDGRGHRAVAGAATGAGVGVPIGAAVSLIVPGIGPIIAFGLLGAALFGAGGAAIGNALENTLTQASRATISSSSRTRCARSVRRDRARGGRGHAQRARDVLREEGALDLDTARDRGGARFPRRSAAVRSGRGARLRCGFEAAQWCDDRENVRPLHGNMIDEPGFQRGWERGHAYRHGRSLRKSA